MDRTHKQSPQAKGGGLRGDDKQQAALRDAHAGARDPTHTKHTPKEADERRSPCEHAQPGADVKPEPDIVPDVDLPEGLRRQPQGPYDRDRGRG